MEQISQKLQNSSAFESLVMEQDVAKALEQRRWNVVQSCYYADLSTQKIREIDIVAVRHVKRGRDQDKLSLHLYLVCECKSARDYHLLFSPSKNHSQLSERTPIQDHWIGYEDKPTRAALLRIFKQAGIEDNRIRELEMAFQQLAYPDDVMRTSSLKLDRPTSWSPGHFGRLIRKMSASWRVQSYGKLPNRYSLL